MTESAPMPATIRIGEHTRPGGYVSHDLGPRWVPAADWNAAVAEIEDLREKLTKTQAALDLRDGELLDANGERDAARAMLAQRDRQGAEVARLRGTREATITAIEDGIAALDIDGLTAYDAERIARVVGAVFRIDGMQRLAALERERRADARGGQS